MNRKGILAEWIPQNIDGGKNMIFRGLMMKSARGLAGLASVLLLLGSLTAVQAQSQTEKNKKIAVAFLTMIFNEHKVEEAFQLYSVPDYKQHNPYAASGAKAAIDFFVPYFKQNPEARTDIKRVIAEGDLVAIHNNSKSNAKDRGNAVVDIFRLENGRVVEHWDVVQPVPEKSANSNTMF
jgi:predicted SnoaL-like aldol condensation-catalyzing enzyme